MAKKLEELYPPKEAEERMAAALRGARLAKPTPLKDVPKKRAVISKKKTVKSSLARKQPS
jgi:hypothetical protein